MEAVRRYQVTGYPTIVFTSSDGGMISKQVGFVYPNQFAPVIETALEKEKDFMKKLAELEKTPDDAKLNAQVALTYLERTQLEKALLFSKEAFKRDPKIAQVFCQTCITNSDSLTPERLKVLWLKNLKKPTYTFKRRLLTSER